MPTWDGETAAGFMGGSSVMVAKNSDHPKEAVEFLQWMNGSKEGRHGLSTRAVPRLDHGQDELASRPCRDS